MTFKGNVRELKNIIERAVVLGSSEWILPEDLPEDFLSIKVENEIGEESELSRCHSVKRKKI